MVEWTILWDWQKVYDMLAGELNIHTSKSMSVEETLHKIPTLKQKGYWVEPCIMMANLMILGCN